MAQFLNEFESRGDGDWEQGDELPEGEKLPGEARAELRFDIDGDEFTMEVEATGLPEPGEVTDPLASLQAGEVRKGDVWDIWLVRPGGSGHHHGGGGSHHHGDSDGSTKAPIQFGNLKPDPDREGRYTLQVDSDQLGMTTDALESIETSFPNETVSLFDTKVACIDVEHLGENAPEAPSRQHRLADFAPDGTKLDWSTLSDSSSDDEQ